ncbi:hypothetical protein QE152_g11008 [Popillia japonica]|uniref:Uncharacterized protein n=1 Tax=Popillia japonica TaxID=7064 RepID=A0AAW1LTB6_POPJA
MFPRLFSNSGIRKDVKIVEGMRTKHAAKNKSKRCELASMGNADCDRGPYACLSQEPDSQEDRPIERKREPTAREKERANSLSVPSPVK